MIFWLFSIILEPEPANKKPEQVVKNKKIVYKSR